MGLGIFDASRARPRVVPALRLVRPPALGEPTLLLAGGAAALWYLTRPERGRERIVQVALSQLGPQDPNKYWREVSPTLVGQPVAWCGGFALWVLRHAGLTDLMWEPGAGFLKALPRTTNPKMGDIAYFNELQHHAIVVKENGQMMQTVDGNQGPGEQVKLKDPRPKSDASMFFSVAPLVGEAA